MKASIKIAEILKEEKKVYKLVVFDGGASYSYEINVPQAFDTIKTFDLEHNADDFEIVNGYAVNYYR